jgi:tripartite-type tricarboxylate transporter receptor subunit TctC
MSRGSLLIGLLAIIVGCSPAAQPSPTAAPAKPAAAPTAAPAAKPAEKDAAAKPAEKAATLAPDYFKDKTVRVITGYEPGSGSDQQARYLAQEWPKFIPGNPRMTVTNQPGASAIIAANGMWEAKPDGMTVYYGSGGGPEVQLARPEEVRYKFDEFVRIGSFEQRPSLWVVLGTAPYKRIQDAIGGDKEFTFGTPTEGDSYEINMLKDFLRLPVRVVYGIQGGTAQTLLAFDRKDVDSQITGGAWIQYAKQRPGWWTDKYVEPFAIIASPSIKFVNNGEMDLPSDVKNVRDFMTDEQKRLYQILGTGENELYRTGFLPPGTPAEIQQVYSDSLATALKDAAFLDGLTKIMGRDPDPFITGPELNRIAKSFDMKELDQLLIKYRPGYKSPF